MSLEIQRALMGRDAEGCYTSDQEQWVGEACTHNILILDRPSEDTSEIIADLDIPVRYSDLADLLEQTLTLSIGFGLISAE